MKISFKRFLTILVVALSVTLLIGYQIGLSAYTSTPIYLDALPSTATYTIEADGAGNYRAIRYDGYEAWDSTNASYVIQSAINALTSGRTWKEKVVLKGSFTISSTIKLPSFTVLDMRQAKLKLAGGLSNVNMVENSDSVGGNQYIDVIGGWLDGTYASSTGKGIYFRLVTNLILRDIRIKEIGGKGIELNGVNVANLDNIWASDTSGVVLDIRESTDVYLHKIDVGGGLGASGYGIVIYASDGVFGDTIHSFMNAQHGLYIDSPAGLHSLSNILVSSNTQYGVALKIVDEQVNLVGGRSQGNAAGNLLLEGAIDWTKLKIKYFQNIVTENSGTATIANNEYVSYGVTFGATPTKILVTTKTPTYSGVPVVVGWTGWTNTTHFQVSAYWVNGTAITADAISISYYAEV